MLVKFLFITFYTIGVLLLIIPLNSYFEKRNRSRLLVRKKRSFGSWKKWIWRKVQGKGEYEEKVTALLKKSGYQNRLQTVDFFLIEAGLPVAVGSVFIVSYLLKLAADTVSAGFPIISFSLLIFAASIVPRICLYLLAWRREWSIALDVARFTYRLGIGVRMNLPLYYAIKKAERKAGLLKPYIQMLLNEWPHDPKKAIYTFGQEVGTFDAIPLANTIAAVFDLQSSAPDSNREIVRLFENQAQNIEKIQDYQIQQRNKLKPLYLTFVIVIPFFALLALMIAPWYRMMVDLLDISFGG